MRGQVLGVDTASGYGQISGDDGRRYRFKPEDWADRVGPAVGANVDFEASEDRAARIYRLPVAPVAGMAPAVPTTDRNKIVAALLAFFLGIFGVHRFYLGRIGSGIVMLLLTCTLIGMAVTGIWGFIDCIRYLIMPDAAFARRYAR